MVLFEETKIRFPNKAITNWFNRMGCMVIIDFRAVVSNPGRESWFVAMQETSSSEDESD